MVVSGNVMKGDASYFHLDQHGLLWHIVLFWYSYSCIWERAVLYRSFLGDLCFCVFVYLYNSL